MQINNEPCMTWELRKHALGPTTFGYHHSTGGRLTTPYPSIQFLRCHAALGYTRPKSSRNLVVGNSKLRMNPSNTWSHVLLSPRSAPTGRNGNFHLSCETKGTNTTHPHAHPI